jgi:hypothetical protein
MTPDPNALDWCIKSFGREKNVGTKDSAAGLFFGQKMRFILHLTLLKLALGATSPSTNVDSNMTSHLEGVNFTSMLMVDDGITVPKTGGDETQSVGRYPQWSCCHQWQ